MNKIGFRIYRFKEGPSVGLTVNEGDWTKKVVDIRDILKLYDSENESKFAMFMSFSENGAYITIARSISGRGGDNTAAWIYIPNNIEVTGTEIISIIDVVKEELSASKSNVERLTQIFNKDYRTTESADYMPSSVEKIFAKRNVGFYPLKDIIGEKRYQPIYSNYHAILISDNDSMEIVDNNLADLTNEILVETFVFCPPVHQDVPNGVTVHFTTSGYPLFNKPVRVNKSSRISLVFKRTGFEDIPYMDSVEENDQICGVPLFYWKKSISRDFFKVIAAHDSNIDLTSDATITINNEELKWHQPMIISEHDARQSKVCISVNGYEPAEGYPNLLNVSTQITVKLHRAERTQSWEIELTNGHTAVMNLHSKYLSGDNYNSPIKGYNRKGGVLRYTNFGVLKQRAIGFLMAVATFIVIFLCVALYEWFDTHKFELQLNWPPLKVEKVGSYKTPSSSTENNSTNPGSDLNPQSTGSEDALRSLSKAIAYLDNQSGKWQRDSLTFYPDLEHLFEELDTYEIDSLLKRASILKASTQFKKVLDAIRENHKKIQENRNKHYKKFCKDENYTIIVTKYIDKLNEPIPDDVAGKAGKAAKTATQPTSEQTDKSANEKKKTKKKGNVM